MIALFASIYKWYKDLGVTKTWGIHKGASISWDFEIFESCLIPEQAQNFWWGHPYASYYGKIAGASLLQFSGELLEIGRGQL